MQSLVLVPFCCCQSLSQLACCVVCAAGSVSLTRSSCSCDTQRLNTGQVRGYSLSASSTTTLFVRAAHEHFMGVFFWTLDGESDIVDALYSGADGIITDSAALVIQVVANWRNDMYRDKHPHGAPPAPVTSAAPRGHSMPPSLVVTGVDDDGNHIAMLCAKIAGLVARGTFTPGELQTLRQTLHCPT